MVGLLILVQVQDVFVFNVASPLQIEVDVWLLNHSESCVFARVYDRVVNVSSVPNFERHEKVLHVFT